MKSTSVPARATMLSSHIVTEPAFAPQVPGVGLVASARLDWEAEEAFKIQIHFTSALGAPVVA